MMFLPRGGPISMKFSYSNMLLIMSVLGSFFVVASLIILLAPIHLLTMGTSSHSLDQFCNAYQKSQIFDSATSELSTSSSSSPQSSSKPPLHHGNSASSSSKFHPSSSQKASYPVQNIIVYEKPPMAGASLSLADEDILDDWGPLEGWHERFLNRQAACKLLVFSFEKITFNLI